MCFLWGKTNSIHNTDVRDIFLKAGIFLVILNYLEGYCLSCWILRNSVFVTQSDSSALGRGSTVRSLLPVYWCLLFGVTLPLGEAIEGGREEADFDVNSLGS